MMQVKGSVEIISSRQVGIWLGLNLLDLGLSLIALEYGRALELPTMAWLLQKPPGSPAYYQCSYIWYGLYKMGLAVIVPAFLVRINRPHLLKWLNIGLVAVCFYITVMLVITFS
ncbi:hypothetical protein ACFLYR_01435 [Chloroflexota bacterium]